LSVGDGLELAGLVVALAVGVPAMIAAIITIKTYIQSSYRHNAGKVPSRRDSDVGWAFSAMQIQ
jgi:hypothetical protein